MAVRALAVLATAVSLLLAPTAADAKVRRAEVLRHDWTLRANEDGRQLVVGNALAGTRVDVGPTARGYRRVYVYGNVNECLWLPAVKNQIRELANQTPRHGCTTFRGMLPNRYARRVNCLPKARPGDPPGTPYGDLHGTNGCTDGSKARINTRRPGCGRVTAYGNVLPWQAHTEPHDRYGVVTQMYRGVKWRYVTRDGRYVMVRDTHKNGGPGFASGRHGRTDWYFVDAKCVDAVSNHKWVPLV